MHNIMEVNGRHNMFSVQETPWHKLGKIIPNHLTSEEAIREAGLDWQVLKTPSQYFNPITTDFETDGKYDLICGANGKRLGIVSNSYKIFQNREAFEFCDALVNSSYNTVMYETAGALGNGETIWMMLSTNKVVTLGQDDSILPYIVLTNNHAGKGSLRAFLTPVRVVCQNTLTAAINGAKNYVSVRHMGNLDQKVEEAQKILGLTMETTEVFAEQADSLTNVLVSSEKQAKDYFSSVMFPNKKEGDESTRSKNIIDDLMNLYEGRGMGSDMKTAKGTAWGLYNAVTQYLDYETTSTQKKPMASFTSNVTGAGFNTKERAFSEALALV